MGIKSALARLRDRTARSSAATSTSLTERQTQDGGTTEATRKPEAAIDRLPYELIEMIILKLDPEDIVIAALELPPQWRRVIEDSARIAGRFSDRETKHFKNPLSEHGVNYKLIIFKTCKCSNCSRDREGLFICRRTGSKIASLLAIGVGKRPSVTIIDPLKTTGYSILPLHWGHSRFRPEIDNNIWFYGWEGRAIRGLRLRRLEDKLALGMELGLERRHQQLHPVTWAQWKWRRLVRRSYLVAGH